MKIYAWPKYIRINGSRDYVETKADPKIVRTTYRDARRRGVLDYKARQALVGILRGFS